MFTKLRLSIKIPAIVFSGALIVGIGIGAASYITASSKVHQLTEERLETSVQTGAADLQRYLKEIEKELRLVAGSPFTINALKEFSGSWKAWSMFGGNPLEELQKAYITDNPHPLGSKHLLDRAETGSHYDNVHETYHPWFRALQQDSGYYDVFLFDAEGNLVYSVFKELDFATNFKAEDSGEWAATDLGNVFRKAIAASTEEGASAIAFEDFEPYAPSADAPASFIAHPIKDAEGKPIGVLAFQMPVEKINGLFATTHGLGETGEVALIGADGLLRNNTETTAEAVDILKTKVEKELLQKADVGTIVHTADTFYRSEMMQAAIGSFDYQGVKFSILAMQANAEAMLPVYAIRDRMALIGLVMLAITGLIGFFASRSITKPIGKLVGEMNELAEGNTSIELKDAARGDEIGDMSKAVVVFRNNRVERERLEEANSSESAKRRARSQRVNEMIDTFRVDVQKGLQAVAANASQMTDTANKLTQLSSDTSDQAKAANSASDRASDNVQTVAASAEELSVSISEISNQIESTTDVVQSATANTNATNEKVSQLAEAANRIGTVVSLIQEIAEQTNLLALNATIEAARAGEAGRGFAVVAAEVKELASQTGKATEEISTQITAIQSSTAEAVEAISEISTIMGDVNAHMASISGAMEQQGAATTQISESVAQAAVGTQTVTENISGVNEASDHTAVSANEVLQASEGLQTEADRLNELISTFLDDVAAA